ncbi:MAG: phosphoserine transaminase [Phycisphaerae bacterium]|nr:phosphoserine transaminase [Phycisphaerae bacterium]
MNKPQNKPRSPYFSSGPTAKRPGWSLNVLVDAWLGRSHRAKNGKARLKQAITLSAEVARIPKDYLVGIVPASDTGAVECALWSLLGARPVTMLSWESFGQGWVTDVTKQLKLSATVMKTDYGQIVDLAKVNWNDDVVFTWNGTTSGVKVPDSFAPPADRQGLAICDATSAVYAMPLPWERLDVVTWSWQKSLGSEAAHGMLVLSPRAVARLESYTPTWPIPKIFRLTKGGKVMTEIFEGSTINTPSMLATEDYIDALKWAKALSYKGKTALDALLARSADNLAAVAGFVAKHPWVDFLPVKPEIRSCTSICLKLTADWFTKLPADQQAAFCKKIASSLEAEGAAYDVGAYRDAPPGFRFWGGPTVDPADMAFGLEWLAWAYEENRPK